MREWFKKDLIESDYVHKPLRIHPENMRETRCLRKKPVKSVLFDDLTSLDNWETGSEFAQMELSKAHTRECENSLKFSSVTSMDHWPNAFGRIYCVPYVMRKVNHEDWHHINRISFWVYPDMPGFHSICLRMQFHNGGEHPVPDRYDREGHHNVNLVDQKWQYVSVEIPYVHRDDVTGISFEYDMVGSEPSATKTACWYITDIMLETLEEKDLDVYEGWHVGPHRIAFSGSGYMVGSEKTAIVNEPGATSFKVVETETGRTVLEKEIKISVEENGSYQVLDFTELQEPGEYLIVCGSIVSRSIAITDGVWEDSIWKVLNFLLCMRCGTEVPGKHYYCHGDSYVWHGERKIITNGGWHDAGDMTQTTTNTGECTYALFELLPKVKNNQPLYDRVLEEAKWGLAWLLKTRFGDGYRCPSSSKSCWTNNILGDEDDIYREAALEPIENFMCAGIEALAAIELKNVDPILSAYSLKCAKEDWKFAYDNKEMEDNCKLDDGNRIYTPCLKYSAAGWAAVDLYNATGDAYYEEMAEWACDEVIACQQQEVTDWDIPFIGFFYDDASHSLIAHSSHRCHDNEPIMALEKAATAFPKNKNYAKWMYAINLYSDYLLQASKYTAPYYVVPASIYHEDEAAHCDDYDMGMIRRYLVDEERKENYKLQVQSGVKLGKGYYLRRQPVAFEHRGQHNVTLCGGKSAAVMATAKNSYELEELAQRQLEWIVGKNPFAESVMFGEGYDYCQEYAVLPGEMVGEMGVGFTQLDEHDAPFWPQVNSCVYREVWIRTTSYYLFLASELYGSAHICGLAEIGKENLSFKNTLSGIEYTAQVCPDTGWYETDLPAGKYEITYKNQIKHMTLLASRQYRLDAPLRDFIVSYRRDAEYVDITVKTNGSGTGSLLIRPYNMDLEEENRIILLGEEVRIRAKISDLSKSFYVAIILDENYQELQEVYGR